MKVKHSPGWRALDAAGFKVRKGYRRQWYAVTTPTGERGHVLMQGPNCWHYFSDEFEASASGTSPENCTRGGLGDAIDTDRQLARYVRLMKDCPEVILRDCAGAYRCSSAAYSEKSKN